MGDTELTDDELRVRVAELCGWTKSHTRSPYIYIGADVLIQVWLSPDKTRKTPNLPDYPGSLDAMHEAEKTLTEEERHAYRDSIKVICERDFFNADGRGVASSPFPVFATARQRATAFVATKGGL